MRYRNIEDILCSGEENPRNGPPAKEEGGGVQGPSRHIQIINRKVELELNQFIQNLYI